VLSRLGLKPFQDVFGWFFFFMNGCKLLFSSNKLSPIIRRCTHVLSPPRLRSYSPLDWDLFWQLFSATYFYHFLSNIVSNKWDNSLRSFTFTFVLQNFSFYTFDYFWLLVSTAQSFSQTFSQSDQVFYTF